MDWTDDLIARLRDLWSQGLSTAEIGRQLSITKNAVVGKAHRLGLPPRPSPIRNKNAQEGGEAEAPAQRKVATPRKKKLKEKIPANEAEAASEVEKKTVAPKAKVKKAEGKQTTLPLESEKKVTAKKAASGQELPEEKAVVKENPVKDTRGEEKKPVAPRAKVKSAPKAKPEAAEIKPIVRPKRVRDIMESPLKRGPSCQWPSGDPGTPQFHFCGAKPLPGKPYCAEHAAIAYVRIRDRREG